MLAGWGKLTDRVILDVQCVDHNENCPDWSLKGECKNTPDFMLLNCPKSCKACKGTGKEIRYNKLGCAVPR